jgi:hypothetical protein
MLVFQIGGNEAHRDLLSLSSVLKVQVWDFRLFLDLDRPHPEPYSQHEHSRFNLEESCQIS